MIINISGRTDIVAFYSKWLENRLEAGFVDSRNPFNHKLVSRIYFDDVDLFVFCTKNPKPALGFIDKIKKPIQFQVTLTSYKEDIEVNVKNKKEIIEAIKELSLKIGKDNVVLRYDPIILNDKYDVNYHIKGFNKIIDILGDYIHKVIISFVDDYKNVRNNKLDYHEPTELEYEIIGKEFFRIAKSHNLIIHTCAEERNLVEFGFDKGDCLSQKEAFEYTSKTYPKWNMRNKNCSCARMYDIGYYNSCLHFCKYCYANFNEKDILKNHKLHNPNSSLLIGELEEDDVIKVVKR